jgi:spoIIIJ-associated protein
MSALLEFKAKRLDQAVEKASAELKIPKKDLKYEVLSYGSSGIFGLTGSKKAKIRVKLPKNFLPGETKTETDKFDSDATPLPDASGRPKKSDTMDSSQGSAAGNETSEGQSIYSFPDDSIETGRLVLQRIVDSITTDAKISIVKEPERICFNVNGGNAGVLIGKRGQTLDAIQTIVEKVVKKHNQNRMRVFVDVEGYLNTRKENLEKMAVRLAEKAKRIRKPISLGQMKAYDRRIVHLALEDFAEVQTRSRGEGPLRKLVIFPKKRNSSKR